MGNHKLFPVTTIGVPDSREINPVCAERACSAKKQYAGKGRRYTLSRRVNRLSDVTDLPLPETFRSLQ